MCRDKVRFVLLVGVLLSLSLFWLGIAVPDEGPYLPRIDVYRHCLEEDDVLVVARYNIPYASTPNETVAQAFIGRFMDGPTELARISPYSYYNRGYGYGGFSMYLDATSAPVWEGSYTVELYGSPTLDWVPSVPSVSTSSMNWRSTSGISATRVLMYAHIIAYANELSDYWNIALTSSTAGGVVLSSYGEAYFTNMIPELRAMCPNLFSGGVTVPEYEDAAWQKEQSEVIKGTWPFDWGGMSQWLGLPSGDEVFRTLIGFVIIFFLCSLIMAKTSRTDFAMLAGFGLLIVLAVPGWISPVIVAGFTFLAVVAAGMVFILGKAG